MIPSARTFLVAPLPMAAALALSGLVAAPAFADAPPPSARERALAVERALAEDRARAAQPAAGLDTQAPVLKSIATTGSVNAQLPDQVIQSTLHIQDDLSGVAYYTIEYESPSNRQYVYRSKRVATPLLKLTPTLDVGSAPFSSLDFSVYDEPGTWRAVYFSVSDAAGNSRQYYESDLALLGTTTFQVTNNGGYDITPPALASGTISTPTVRLSKPPKGTAPGTPPYVSADLSVTDAGNGVVSGTSAAYFYFCHPDGSGGCDDYLYLYGTTNRAGLVANTMTVGTQLRADQTLGQYVIYYLEVDDVAGNYTFYESTAFGGSTNFATYFPTGTTIFVNQ
jgi:hypothetical protein